MKKREYEYLQSGFDYWRQQGADVMHLTPGINSFVTASVARQRTNGAPSFHSPKFILYRSFTVVIQPRLNASIQPAIVNYTTLN